MNGDGQPPPRRRARELHVDVAADGTRPAMAAARVRALARFALAAQRARVAMLSITFVGPHRIAAINRRALGHRGSTDIVTLAFRATVNGAMPVVADIYICPEVARRNARAVGIPVREETARLVIHGVLHALGREHPEDGRREQSGMWRRQEALVTRSRAEGLW